VSPFTAHRAPRSKEAEDMATAVAPAAPAPLPSLAAGFRPSIPIRSRYDNWIGGQYVAPVRGQYFTNPTPVTGRPLCEVARSTHEDVDKALDAAHAAAGAWNTSSPAVRANILNKIADRLEASLDTLAFIETMDNGKPIRETTHADMPLAVDHFRYFAGTLRAQEGGISEIDHDTSADRCRCSPRHWASCRGSCRRRRTSRSLGLVDPRDWPARPCRPGPALARALDAGGRYDQRPLADACLTRASSGWGSASHSRKPWCPSGWRRSNSSCHWCMRASSSPMARNISTH
jgi:hypothetical protein